MSSAYHAIPAESRDLLESATRMFRDPMAPLAIDELVLMVYNLGRCDGRVQQLASVEAMIDENLGDVINAYAEQMLRRDAELRQSGRPEHDLDSGGNPLKPGR